MNIPFPARGMGRRPPSLCCYICGREYGTNSLRIHLPQCQKLWEQREALKPKHERRPLPRPPPDLDRVLGGGGTGGGKVNVDEYNDMAFRTYTDEALVPCEFCGRKFLPQSLTVHNRSCTRDRPAARVVARTSTQTQQTKPGATQSMGPVATQTLGPASGFVGAGGDMYPPLNPKPMPLSARGPTRSHQPGADAGDDGVGLPPIEGASAPHEVNAVYHGAHDSAEIERKFAGTRADGSAVRDGGEALEGGELSAEEPLSARSGASVPSSTAANFGSTSTSRGGERSITSVTFAPSTLPDMLEAESEGTVERVQCSMCQRYFAPDRIDKHSRVCKGPIESKSNKRTTYDPRRAIAEAESQSSDTSRPAKDAKWKREHEEFQAALRTAKLAQAIIARGGNISKELPPPPPSENPDYIMCPYCTRRFNPQAAERHIPHCRTAITRPKPPPRAAPAAASSQAGARSALSPYQQPNASVLQSQQYPSSPRRPSLSNSNIAGAPTASPITRQPSTRGISPAMGRPPAGSPMALQRLPSSRVGAGSIAASPPRATSPNVQRSSSIQRSPFIQRTPSARLPPNGQASPLKALARDMGLGMENPGPMGGTSPRRSVSTATPAIQRTPSVRAGTGAAAMGSPMRPSVGAPQPAASPQRFCTQCGTPRRPTDRFCGGCGCGLT